MIAGDTLYIHYFGLSDYVMWSALLVGARQAIKSVAASIMRSAWPLASKHCHKPSHQLDDDLPPHASNPGTEPQAARSVYTTRDFFLTPGGKNYDQKLLAVRILTENTLGGVYGIFIFCGVFVYTTRHR